MLASKLLSCVGGEEKLYSNSVFSAYTYTGNGATQTITNGIDLAGKGGMVWTKTRSGGNEHALIDTVQGATYELTSASTAARDAGSLISSFNSSGYSFNTANFRVNNSANTYVGWTFRKAPKFFDVVTFTAPASGTFSVPHSLSQEVGMLVVKRTDSSSGWVTYHRSVGSGKWLRLESTAAETVIAGVWNTVSVTNVVLTVGLEVAASGQYVAYLFAHDPSADGIVQCGAFTGNTTVTLGWEPQFVMIKRTDAAGDWIMIDSSRGCAVGGVDAILNANLSNAESSTDYIDFTATGFITKGLTGNYIYTVIRQPNKPPTVGTQVYNAIARTGTGAAATVTGVGFAPDLAIIKSRSAVNSNVFSDRLRGAPMALFSESTGAETNFTTALVTEINMGGIKLGDYTQANASGTNYINHFFKRAPGVFDQVCYTGTGVATTAAHGLGVVPELMIAKARSSSTGAWVVYAGTIGVANSIFLNNTAASAAGGHWNSTAPTASVLSIAGSGYGVNDASATYVAYLFATKAGISKVFSYVGNGSSQTVDCGFTTGARYVLVKSVSATGNWNVGDSTRGLTSGTDPLLYLNSTAAEITTDDWLDPTNVGFIVNETTNAHANVNGVTYIGLAIS